MQDQVSAVNSLAKSKRKSPIDTLMIVGTVLTCMPSVGIYFLKDNWLVVCPILIMCLGIGVIIYSLRMHLYLCKNSPEMLMPMETQVQTKILRMLLSDDISEQNRVDILKQLSGPANMNHPSLGGE